MAFLESLQALRKSSVRWEREHPEVARACVELRRMLDDLERAYGEGNDLDRATVQALRQVSGPRAKLLGRVIVGKLRMEEIPPDPQGDLFA